MKRNIVWTLFLVAALFFTMAAVAKDNAETAGYECSPAKVAGTWGYSETGTTNIAAYGGAYPYSSVGSYTLDSNGNLSGYRTAAFGPFMNLKAWIVGTATVNPDCTGTVTLSFYSDPELTKPAGNAGKFIVYVDKAREARMIITSGGFDWAVLVTEAKKMFPGQGSELGE